MATILDAKRAVERALLTIPGVAGVGVNWQNQTIRVYVEGFTPAIDAAVPRSMSGYDVEIIVTGIFTTRKLDALLPDPHRRIRWRPAFGGVSAGHVGVTAGTLGGVVTDVDSGELLAISNNHVFANCTTTDSLRAAVGDAIMQPAWYDAGTPMDGIATLERWIPIDLDGDNLVDCAVARPVADGLLNPYVVGNASPEGALRGIAVRGTAPVSGGEVVHKYGRTTGHTSGTVIDTDFTTIVTYDTPTPPVFVDQILACIRVEGGDSGSLLLDDQDRAVGLIIASAESDGVYYTVANKIRNVEAMLGVTVPTMDTDMWIPGFDAVRDPLGATARVPSLVWMAAGVALGAVTYRLGRR